MRTLTASAAPLRPLQHRGGRSNHFEGDERLTHQENSERTAGGLVGKVAGKAKAAVGSLVGNGDLAREGRLQQAQVDAEAGPQRRDAEAQQRDAEAKMQADRTATAIERQRAPAKAPAPETEHHM